MNPLLELAIEETPNIIGLFKYLFHKKNGVVPTDEEVIQAYKDAFDSSLAKDDDWLAKHPA